ncbi:hypothetical protein ACWF99_23670 [Nocardia sp. NPDC055002]
MNAVINARKKQVIDYAADRYIALTPEDITNSAGTLTIDGMNPFDWVDAMSQD